MSERRVGEQKEVRMEIERGEEQYGHEKREARKKKSRLIEGNTRSEG